MLIYDYTPKSITLFQLILMAGGLYTVGVDRAADALRLCQTHPVSLVLSEFMGYDMNGLDLCRQLRATPYLEQPLLLFISARGMLTVL